MPDGECGKRGTEGWRESGVEPGEMPERCPRELPPGLSHWLWGKASVVNGRRRHLSRQWTPRVPTWRSPSLAINTRPDPLFSPLASRSRNVFRNRLFRLSSTVRSLNTRHLCISRGKSKFQRLLRLACNFFNITLNEEFKRNFFILNVSVFLGPSSVRLLT